MRDQLKWLEELQKHDAKIKELSEALEAIPAKIKATENDLARVESLLASERAQLEDARKYLNEQRSLLEFEGQQVVSAKQKLSQAKNPREATAAQREIDQTREMSQSREGEIKKLVEAITSKEAVLAERANEVQGLKDVVDKDRQAAEGKMVEVRGQLEQLHAERETLAANVKPDVLKRYASIRNKKGSAVSPVRNGTCSACNMNIPPQLFNVLRRGTSIETCPYCHRIVYFEEARSEAPAEGAPAEA